jgi:hypothetical protein
VGSNFQNTPKLKSQTPPSGRYRYDVISAMIERPTTRQRHRIDEKFQWNSARKMGSNFHIRQCFTYKQTNQNTHIHLYHVFQEIHGLEQSFSLSDFANQLLPLVIPSSNNSKLSNCDVCRFLSKASHCCCSCCPLNVTWFGTLSGKKQ